MKRALLGYSKEVLQRKAAEDAARRLAGRDELQDSIWYLKKALAREVWQRPIAKPVRLDGRRPDGWKR